MTSETIKSDTPATTAPVPVDFAGRRLDVLAAKVSYAMSLTMLASPFILLLLPSPVAVPQWRLSQSADLSTDSSLRADSGDGVAGAEKYATAAPALKIRTIPIVEVKVRREARPQTKTLTEQAPDTASKSAATVQPPVTLSVPVAPMAPLPSAGPARSGPIPVASEPSPAIPNPTSWSEIEISDALRACLTTLAPLRIEMDTQPPLREGNCGLAAPISIRRIGVDKVEVQPPALVNCAMAKALDEWLVNVAQPAARETLGSPIIRLTGTSGYSCRNRNGAAGGPISEHAFGNALDVSGFVLADGRTIGLSSHWGPTAKDAKAELPAEVVTAKLATQNASTPAGIRASIGQRSGLGGPTVATGSATPGVAATLGPSTTERSKESSFLRRVHAGACGMFGTVLGPEANEAHRDHLHIDLKGRKRAGICQ